MCKHGTTINGIDSCIHNLVKILNDNDIVTVASCCGHGNRSGNIALADGRELIIAKNFEEARNIDKFIGIDIHGKKLII